VYPLKITSKKCFWAGFQERAVRMLRHSLIQTHVGCISERKGLDEGYSGASLACLNLSGTGGVAESLGMGAERQAQHIFRVTDTKRSALACTFGP
jgi:hypothetical protein